jgi:alkylhydroperoxidase/carboxymuconolactone decarboxylase family protein YurZ
MAYIQTVSTDEADGRLQELYAADQKGNGYVPNYTQVMSLNPEAIEGWRKLSGAVRGKLRLRTYELATFAAAMALRCRY